MAQTSANTPTPGGGKAIVSVVLGILGALTSLIWFLGLPLSVLGLVLGLLSRKSNRRNIAIVGIVFSCIGLAIIIFIFVVALLYDVQHRGGI